MLKIRFYAVCTPLLALALFAPPAAAQDMPLADVLVEGQGWELVAEGFQFTEGPAVDGQGNLFFTDVRANRIHKVDSAGQLSVFLEDSGAANGLMFGPDGRLYGCQNGLKRITAWDADARATTIAEDVESNDLVVSGKGAIYFTDPNNHRVWYVSPQGEKRVVDDGIERPNGIILWPDQATLVVADSIGNHLWAFRVEPDGGLAHKQPYYTVRMGYDQERSGSDGMTIDATGRLFVATALGLQMFDPTGRLSGVMQRPQPGKMSNAVFGGPDLSTLYVTCGDKVFRRQTKTTGVLYWKQ